MSLEQHTEEIDEDGEYVDDGWHDIESDYDESYYYEAETDANYINFYDDEYADFSFSKDSFEEETSTACSTSIYCVTCGFKINAIIVLD